MIRAPARTETKGKKGRPHSSTPLAGSGLKGGTSYLAFFSSSLPTSVTPSISGFKKFSRARPGRNSGAGCFCSTGESYIRPIRLKQLLLLPPVIKVTITHTVIRTMPVSILALSPPTTTNLVTGFFFGICTVDNVIVSLFPRSSVTIHLCCVVPISASTFTSFSSTGFYSGGSWFCRTGICIRPPRARRSITIEVNISVPTFARIVFFPVVCIAVIAFISTATGIPIFLPFIASTSVVRRFISIRIGTIARCRF